MSDSRFKPPSVIRQQRRRRLLVLLCAMAATLVLWLGYHLGQHAAVSGLGLDLAEYHRLQMELPKALERIEDMTRELEVQQTRHAVDRRALEILRSDLAAQKEEIASLEEGLRFYRSLMAPGEIAQGLSLRELELIAGREPGRFGFRIVAQQEAIKHQLLTGELRAELFGTLNGEPVSYPLSALSDDVQGDAIPLRFRYFQSIEGELLLPEGFIPERVQLDALATKPREASVSQVYSWEVKERFTHAGR